MDLRNVILLSGFLAAAHAIAAASSAPAVTMDSRITVQFLEPEKFTDIRDSWADTTDSQREWVLSEIRKFVQARGDSNLREGLHLKVEFTDIDLAGDFEPWRFRTNQDIRVVKEIYPVRIKLVFQLTDSTGTVLAEGERRLTDFGRASSFMPGSDPLRLEKEVLRDWLAREFREFRKA